MTDTTLAGKKVVVIGGTSGIGFGVAKAAQDAGAAIVVGSSKATNVEAALGRLGAGAQGWAVDVTTEADVAGFFERIGPFDHLVYTAGDWGTRSAGRAADWDIAAIGAIFAVRFWGAVTAIKYAHRLISDGGSITLTDGGLAHRPRKGAALNTAMLGAIEHLGVGLALELAPVRVNVVCPGMILTEVWATTPREQLLERAARQPVPRPGEPSEVAEAYLYLMRGTYTTGQVLHVDGGSALI